MNSEVAVEMHDGRWKRYPAYRDSGVEWIGDVPKEWSSTAVKHHFDIQLGKMLQNKPDSDELLVPYAKALHVLWGKVETNDLPEMWANTFEIQQYGIKEGDLLVCEGGEVGRAGIVKSPSKQCIIQNALHRVRAKNSSDLRYLLYVLHAVNSSIWFDVLCNKATIAHFTREKFSDLNIPVPPLPEQRAIATFLDRETGRIDTLIEKKERQVELLQEKRAALISHAVTKGLDTNFKMKDSGMKWLGEVPEHWNIGRAKLLFQEINDRSTSGEETLLTVSHITGVTRRSEKNVNMFMAESLEGYKICEAGDLVINTMWAWMGAMGIAPERGIVSPSYNVYRLRTQENEPSFYDYLFRTGQFVSEVICHSKGIWSSRLRLYPESFFEIQIPFPPQEEQRGIVSLIQKETGSYKTFQRKIEKSIEKLSEYRTALISAAVTGKIDVRQEVMT